MEKLYQKFKEAPASIEYCINFYDDNLLVINGVKNFDSERNLLNFVEIYYGCLFSLFQKSQFNKGIDTIIVLPIIENGIDEFKIDRAKFDRYIWLLWQIGIAYYNLKVYDESVKLFKKIYEYEPDNDKIKEWLENAKLHRVTKYHFVFLIVAFIGLAIDILGKAFIAPNIRFVISTVALLIFIASFILEIFIRRKRRKMTK